MFGNLNSTLKHWIKWFSVHSLIYMVDSSHTDRYALFLLDHVISRRRWDVSHVATPTHYGRVRMNNYAEYYINRGVGPRLSENSIDLTFSNNFRQSPFTSSEKLR